MLIALHRHTLNGNELFKKSPALDFVCSHQCPFDKRAAGLFLLCIVS